MNLNKSIFGSHDDETIVFSDRVSCDGGSLGHPKIYLSVNETEVTVCPYCSHKFLKKDIEEKKKISK